MTPAEFQRLKDRIQAKEREAERAAGAIQEIEERLETDYGCRTTNQAEKLLRRLEREIAKDEKELDKQMKVFEEKWGDYL